MLRIKLPIAARVFTLLAGLLVVAGCAGKSAPKSLVPANPDLILATTTSTVDSGLLDELIPIFEQATGYKVKPIGVGSGQAMAMGERGEADALLVHAPSDEEKLVKAEIAVNRRLVMHNDFIIVGPAADPAAISGISTAAAALAKIAEQKALFISRADDSGTHKKELTLWRTANVTPSGNWYIESGTGMGQTLLIAAERNGYTLTDRGTFLANQKNVNLKILLEGDAPLLNIYHVMQVNPQKYDRVNAAAAEAFVEFMVSENTQALIGKYGIEKYGLPLFFPDAHTTYEKLTAGQ